MARFPPSLKPAWRSPSRNASTKLAHSAGDVLPRMPIVCLPGCWPRATTGHAAAPTSEERKARLLIQSPVADTVCVARQDVLARGAVVRAAATRCLTGNLPSDSVPHNFCTQAGPQCSRLFLYRRRYRRSGTDPHDPAIAREAPFRGLFYCLFLSRAAGEVESAKADRVRAEPLPSARPSPASGRGSEGTERLR
jgi:hypothetical protein